MVCSRGTANDVPRSARSVICLETSAGASCVWVLVEKEIMLPGSGTLDEVEKMVLSCGASVGSWCFWDPFSWWELDWAGGIGTRCLSTPGFCRFSSLLLQKIKFHELDIRKGTDEVLIKMKVTDEVPVAADVS